jgi:hypothetical protein
VAGNGMIMARERNENDRCAREGARRMKIKEEIMNCTFHRLLQSA